jgi:hypothetical protein
MTSPVLNAITFGYWEQWGLDTTTEVIRWVTAVCGFINSDFFNGRGSIIAVLNVFLLRYGHLFSKDADLKEVLKNFNGSQLYLRRLEVDVPVGKAMLLLDSCGDDIVKSVLAEATEGDDNPSITMDNWGQVIKLIEGQRNSNTVADPSRLSSNIYSFSRKTRQNYEKTSLRNDDCDPNMLLIQSDSEQQASGQQGRYGSFRRDEEDPTVKSVEDSASCCAIM